MRFEALRTVKSNRVMICCCVVFIAVTAMIVEKVTDNHSQNSDSGLKNQLDKSQQEKRKSFFLTDRFAKLQDPFRLQRSQDKIVRKEETERKISHEIDAGKRQAETGSPVLTGIAESAAERMAIIEIGKKSGIYREHEKIGAYEVLRIAQDNVVLMGKGGYLELKVARQ